MHDDSFVCYPDLHSNTIGNVWSIVVLNFGTNEHLLSTSLDPMIAYLKDGIPIGINNNHHLFKKMIFIIINGFSRLP